MILGIGIDIIEIERFKDWHTKPVKQLARIFSPEEIAYCLETPKQSAERFALRFAAKEAFYKALCAWQQSINVPFITLCKRVSVAKYGGNVPHLEVAWDNALQVPYVPLCHVTLSHSGALAIAQVILEKRTIL